MNIVIRDVTESCQREDCRVTIGDVSSTLIGWTPVYDRNGNQVNADPNVTSQTVKCHVCGRHWIVIFREDGGWTISQK